MCIRPIYVNVDSPNLGFPYFNFLGGYQWREKHPVRPSHDIHLTFPKIIHDVDCQAQMYVIFLLLCEDKEKTWTYSFTKWHGNVSLPNERETFIHEIEKENISSPKQGKGK